MGRKKAGVVPIIVSCWVLGIFVVGTGLNNTGAERVVVFWSGLYLVSGSVLARGGVAGPTILGVLAPSSGWGLGTWL